MNLLLLTLMALPGQSPGYRFDGDWTIVSVDYNGKTSEAKAKVVVKQHRLVLNEGKGEQVTLEFDANNRCWMWAGKNKPPKTPPPPEKVPFVGNGVTTFWMPDGTLWMVEPLSRMPMPAPIIEIPRPYTTLATPGFFSQNKDQVQIFFLPIGEEGPSLTLVLQREAAKK